MKTETTKIAVPVMLGLGVGFLALMLLTRKAEAAPGEPELPPPVVTPPPETFPTPDDIMAAQTLAELDAFYRLISEQLITGQINHFDYMALYSAYEIRFYELAGGE